MRKYRSQEEWDLILEEYSRSEQSLEMFCQERALNKSSMYRRVRKLSQKGSEFVELPRGRLPQQDELSARGVTLRIPSNESAARIADLVRVLGC